MNGALLRTSCFKGVRSMLAKRITPDGVIPFGDCYLYDIEPINLQSFDEMVMLLETIKAEPTYCLIRGLPVAAGKYQRRLLRDQPNGSKATIRASEDGLPWIMLDIDKMAAPAGLATNEARLDYIVSQLPPEFHDTTFYYKWSSSAGLEGWDTLSVHLWFWLDEPMECKNLHDRSSKRDGDWFNIVDPAPYTPNQIHYTAQPVFQGVTDPLGGERSGIVHGRNDVAKVKRWVAPYYPRAVYTRGQVEAANPGMQMAELLEEIGNPHHHLPILKAIGHYVATVPLVLRDRDKIKGEILQRTRAANYVTADYLTRIFDMTEAKWGNYDLNREYQN